MVQFCILLNLNNIMLYFAYGSNLNHFQMKNRCSGSRYIKNGKSDDDTFLTIIGNYIFSKIGKIFFNIKLSDILYTYAIANTSKFKELDVISNDFCFCVEFPIKVEKNKFSYSGFR